MLKVGKTILSDDLIENQFVCDLDKCKGACCVEGDLGAPLEKDELPILEEIFEEVRSYLSPEGLQAIEEQGLYVFDEDGEYSTTTIGGKECAYAIYDQKGILKCGIEQAHRDGKISWQKPISCHLYPVRISKYDDFEALNYDRWHVCNPACELGKKLGTPIFEFVKGALIRKYGKQWFEELTNLVDSEKGTD